MSKSVWDDPENPVVDTHKMNPLVTINVRKRDQEMAKLLSMEPWQCAVARQPIGLGIGAFDLADKDAG